MNHDIVAIAGSAGSLEVLLQMVRDLPADLPAALFVVLHTSPSHPSHLPELLSGRGRLPASHPLDGDKIIPGHIYVAPPDNHLLVRPGLMEVTRGPKENGHRPAADALFRTASSHYGPRVVGVVLSGYQDCGTAGMMSVKARGGLGVVQAPDSAVAADMPRSVLDRVKVDFVVSPAELAGLLARLVATPAGAEKRPDTVISRLEGRERESAPSWSVPSARGA